LEHFWKKGINIIKEKVTKQNFETWISPVRISSMDGADVEPVGAEPLLQGLAD